MSTTGQNREWEDAEYRNQANYFPNLYINMDAIFDGLKKACSAENERNSRLDSLNLEFETIKNNILNFTKVDLTAKADNSRRIPQEQLITTIEKLETFYNKIQQFNQENNVPPQQKTDKPSIRQRLRFTGNSPAKRTDPVSNLIEEGLSQLQEFKAGNMHPARSAALGKIRSAVFQDGTPTPSAYLKMLLKSENANENKLKAGVKVFAKRKFGRTTNHPERKILKLLCQYRGDDTIEAHKHNSKILHEINSLSASSEKSSGDIKNFLEAIHTASDDALSHNNPDKLRSAYSREFTSEIAGIIEEKKENTYITFNADGYTPGK